MSHKEIKLIRTAGALSLISVSTVAISFLSGMVSAGLFGTGTEMESFLVADSIVQFLMNAVMIGGLSTVFIPLYSEYKSSQGPEKAAAYARSLMSFFTLLVIVVSAAAYFLRPWLVGLAAPGMGPVARALCSSLIAVMLFSIAAQFFLALFRGALNSCGIFSPPALAALGLGVLNLALMLALGEKAGVWILAVVSVDAVLLPLMLFFFYRDKLSVFLNFSFDFSHPGLRRSLKLLLAASLVGVLTQLTALADKFFASSLAPGSIAVYSYSVKIIPLFISVFVANIAQPLFVRFSAHSGEGDGEALSESLAFGLKLVGFAAFPLAFFLLLNRTEIFSLVYERGKFSSADVAAVSGVFVFVFPSLLFWSLGQILVSALYAMKLNRHMLVIVACGVALNIAMSAWLAPAYGLPGIAVSSGLYAAFGTLMMFRVLIIRLPGLPARGLSVFFLKVLFISGVSAFAARELFALGSPASGWAAALRLAFSFAVFSSLYLLLVRGFGVSGMTLQDLRSVFRGGAEGAGRQADDMVSKG